MSPDSDIISDMISQSANLIIKARDRLLMFAAQFLYDSQNMTGIGEQDTFNFYKA